MVPARQGQQGGRNPTALLAQRSNFQFPLRVISFCLELF